VRSWLVRAKRRILRQARAAHAAHTLPLEAYAAAKPCMNVSTRNAKAMRHAASAAGA